MRIRGKDGFLKSFRGQLIVALLVISALPLIAIQGFSFYQIEGIMQDNNNALIEANMTSMLRSVTLTLNAYESVLNQLYTDDNLVALIEKLNVGQETALSTNQLMRTLGAACNARSYIQGITVLLADGGTVFYDKLTGSTIRNAWMEQGGVDPKALYDEVSGDNRLHLLPTQFAAQVGHERVSLFHMARRAINYKHIERRIGVIVLSIDERLIGEVLSDDGALGVNILLDGDGRVFSCPVDTFLGMQLEDPARDCVELAAQGDDIKASDLRAYTHHMEGALGWQLVSVVDQGAVLLRVQSQQYLQWTLLLSTLLVLSLVIALVTGRLTASVHSVAAAMHSAGAGDMGARVELDARMPVEMATIADGFNQMMGDIDHLIGQARLASEKERDAQIALLEAQINPHFLYNTLDAINWMAIDENQMEVSNAITALARILRYSIDRSNQTVSVGEEADWLRQYLSLQQMRLKHNFVYELDVSDAARSGRIHKLLFQPFVENAIRHGFEGVKRERRLTIRIGATERELHIEIEDNGRGMDAAQLAEIRSAIARHEEQPGHIGILNAASRMRMYYGDAVEITLDSAADEGTRVFIKIPYEEATACASQL